jgi:hypothetical protein
MRYNAALYRKKEEDLKSCEIMRNGIGLSARTAYTGRAGSVQPAERSIPIATWARQVTARNVRRKSSEKRQPSASEDSENAITRAELLAFVNLCGRKNYIKLHFSTL